MFDGLRARTARHRTTLAIDWRGHGETSSGADDFGTAELVADAADVIERAGITRVVPLAAAHAGWVAIELRRRLGPERVPAIVLLDWMVLGTPPGFGDALAGLRDPDRWQEVRDSLVALWTKGVDNPDVLGYVDVMAGYDAAMWARAGREIAAEFAAHHTPLAALEPLGCPTLHLYAQPADEDFLAAQRDYAVTHPWFRVQRLRARSHFPSLEAPDAVAAAIDALLREVDSSNGPRCGVPMSRR